MQQCDRFTLCVDKKGAAGAAFKDSHAEEEGELSKHHLLTQACALFSTYPWILGGAGPCRFMQLHNLWKITPPGPQFWFQCISPSHSLCNQLVGWLSYSPSSSGKRDHRRGDCLSTIGHYCWDNLTCSPTPTRHRRSPKLQQPPISRLAFWNLLAKVEFKSLDSSKARPLALSNMLQNSKFKDNHVLLRHFRSYLHQTAPAQPVLCEILKHLVEIIRLKSNLNMQYLLGQKSRAIICRLSTPTAPALLSLGLIFSVFPPT